MHQPRVQWVNKVRACWWSYRYFCKRFYWTQIWVDKRLKDFKNRKQWSSNPTSSRADLSSLARKQWASCGGWKEQGVRWPHQWKTSIANNLNTKLNVNFLPGNVVPLDSIGVEVVQDSEADLEKKWINNSFEVSGHTITMMVMDIRWKTNLRMGRVLSGSTVVRLGQVGSWRKQGKVKTASST